MSSNNVVDQKLGEFFSVPSLPPSQLCPQRLPGANLESLAALLEVLKDNHQRHHIYLNDRGYHNHITHRALAVYVLGGSATIIRDYYKHNSHVQRPAFDSPESITEENFADHLGDENFYQAYVSFFSERISKMGATSTLEEFVFSKKYNYQKGGDANTQPEMLGRFFSGLVHPFIHTGYGLEFGLKGMLVEGLAQTAIHGVHVRELVHPSLFSGAPGTPAPPIVAEISDVHTFDIVARMLKDVRFNRKAPTDFANEFMQILIECASIVKEHTDKWTINAKVPGEVERKMEELVWLSSLIYGVGGLKSHGHQSDFFLMHMVTSSLFLPSLIAYLSPRSQVLLLRAYLVTVLTWWAARGRPTLDIKSFMTSTSVGCSPSTTAAPKMPLTTETTPTPNPFLPILQSAIAHPEDHLLKVQRTFAHYDTLYGTRPAGYFKSTELADAKLLDGSLFLRNALLTADSVGWVREGQEFCPFSVDGFYT